MSIKINKYLKHRPDPKTEELWDNVLFKCFTKSGYIDGYNYLTKDNFIIKEREIKEINDSYQLLPIDLSNFLYGFMPFMVINYRIYVVCLVHNIESWKDILEYIGAGWFKFVVFLTNPEVPYQQSVNHTKNIFAQEILDEKRAVKNKIKKPTWKDYPLSKKALMDEIAYYSDPKNGKVVTFHTNDIAGSCLQRVIMQSINDEEEKEGKNSK